MMQMQTMQTIHATYPRCCAGYWLTRTLPRTWADVVAGRCRLERVYVKEEEALAPPPSTKFDPASCALFGSFAQLAAALHALMDDEPAERAAKVEEPAPSPCLAHGYRALASVSLLELIAEEVCRRKVLEPLWAEARACAAGERVPATGSTLEQAIRMTLGADKQHCPKLGHRMNVTLEKVAARVHRALPDVEVVLEKGKWCARDVLRRHTVFVYARAGAQRGGDVMATVESGLKAKVREIVDTLARRIMADQDMMVI